MQVEYIKYSLGLTHHPLMGAVRVTRPIFLKFLP